MLERVVYAGTNSTSFAQADAALRHLADLAVGVKQVERVTRRIGEERCAERDAAVEAYRVMSLVERKAAPTGVAAPDLAVVQMDGGRLQILDRSAAATPAQDAPSSHWREDKVGLLATMSSAVSTADPCPKIPEHFVNPLRILKLAKEIKGVTGVAEADVPAVADETATAAETLYPAPELQQRSVVATRGDAHQFGAMLTQAAWARGFYGATRRAFVCDGSSANWGVWERHFSNFTPIVDFIHALTYVFAAAMAGRSFTDGWSAYMEWMQQLWVGQVESIIAALAQRQVELGPLTADEPDTSPRNRVAETLGYLQNQKQRMRYADYRTQGLPITSSHIESTIKRINQRVKGSEKFWSEGGAEAILQLRADMLSESDPLAAFWERRQATSSGQRNYSLAA